MALRGRDTQQSRNTRKNGEQPKPPGGGGEGFNAFYGYQIFTLHSAVVKNQEILSSHGSLQTIAMYHHGETL